MNASCENENRRQINGYEKPSSNDGYRYPIPQETQATRDEWEQKALEELQQDGAVVFSIINGVFLFLEKVVWNVPSESWTVRKDFAVRKHYRVRTPTSECRVLILVEAANLSFEMLQPPILGKWRGSFLEGSALRRLPFCCSICR